MNAVNFAQWVYDNLQTDDVYKNYLNEVILPSSQTKRKADVSSAAGKVVGSVVGIGWKSLMRATITLKEQSPIWAIIINETKEGSLKLHFLFPVSGYITNNELKKLEIKPEKQGVINKKVVGVKYDCDCAGKANICKDDELRKSLFRLFTTQRLCDISDWTQAPITAEVLNKNNCYVGKIEARVASLDQEGLMLLFGSAIKISKHINLALKPNESVTKQEAKVSGDSEKKENSIITVNLPTVHCFYLAKNPKKYDFNVNASADKESLLSATVTDWLGNSTTVNSGDSLPNHDGCFLLSLVATDKGGNNLASLKIPFYVIDPKPMKVDCGGGIIKYQKKTDYDVEMVRFYFDAEYKQGAVTPKGQIYFETTTGKPHNIKQKFSCSDSDWLFIHGSQAMFQGMGIYNKGPFLYRLYVKNSLNTDNPPDFVRLQIWTTLDTTVPPAFSYEGVLDKGNIKIRA